MSGVRPNAAEHEPDGRLALLGGRPLADDALRPAGGARGVDHALRRLRRRLGPARRTRPASPRTPDAGRSAGDVRVTRPRRAAGRRRRPRRSGTRSVCANTTRLALSSSRYASSAPFQCQLTGTGSGAEDAGADARLDRGRCRCAGRSPPGRRRRRRPRRARSRSGRPGPAPAGIRGETVPQWIPVTRPDATHAGGAPSRLRTDRPRRPPLVRTGAGARRPGYCVATANTCALPLSGSVTVAIVLSGLMAIEL